MDRLLLLGLQMEKLESLTLYPDHSHTAGNHSFLDWIIAEACVVWPDSGTFLEPSGGGSLLNYRKCCKSWACEVLDATPHQPDGDILTAGMQDLEFSLHPLLWLALWTWDNLSMWLPISLPIWGYGSR